MRKRKIVNNTFRFELFFDMRNVNNISNAKNKKENEEVIYQKKEKSTIKDIK